LPNEKHKGNNGYGGKHVRLPRSRAGTAFQLKDPSWAYPFTYFIAETLGGMIEPLMIEPLK
jgi:hypothetical protein